MATFEAVCSRLVAGYLSGNCRATAQRVHSIHLIIRMVMAVHAVEHLGRYAEEAADLVHGHPELRLPCNRRVSEGVRHHVRPQAGCLPGGPKRLVNSTDRLAIPLDHRPHSQPTALPATQVRQKARW